MSEGFSCSFLNCQHCCCHCTAVWLFKELLPTTVVLANQSLQLCWTPQNFKTLSSGQTWNASSQSIMFTMRLYMEARRTPESSLPNRHQGYLPLVIMCISSSFYLLKSMAEISSMLLYQCHLSRHTQTSPNRTNSRMRQ